jgi:hypothetical protein
MKLMWHNTIGQYKRIFLNHHLQVIKNDFKSYDPKNDALYHMWKFCWNTFV